MKRNKIIPAKFVQSNFHDQIKVVPTIKNVQSKHDRIHEMSLKEERNEIKDFFEDPASSYQSGFEIFLSENVNIEEYQCDQCFKIKEEMHTDKTNFKKRNRFRRRL